MTETQRNAISWAMVPVGVSPVWWAAIHLPEVQGIFSDSFVVNAACYTAFLGVTLPLLFGAFNLVDRMLTSNA
jgi:hypothetical protein